jgi:hypothetical protein
MADSAAGPGAVQALARINPRLLGAAALGGLLGGVIMFFVVAGYNASAGMGFLTLLNVCFAAWVFRSAGMPMAASMPEKHMAGPVPTHTAMASPMPTHSAMASHAGTGGHGMGAATMMSQPIVASHAIVGGLLHLAMSAAAGIAFAVVLAVLIRAGVRLLAGPAAYVAAAVVGGALLYVIMMYGSAPLWNREIVDFTPRVPFFASHLLFGATVGGWVYWRLGYAGAGMRLRARRPGLGGAG